MESIPLSECEHGFLYRIRSRNLSCGVFNENALGFIGIREKFGRFYLFTEYHEETGPPHGTAFPIKKLTKVPDGIPIREGESIKAKDSHSFGVWIDNLALHQWINNERKRLDNISE